MGKTNDGSLPRHGFSKDAKQIQLTRHRPNRFLLSGLVTLGLLSLSNPLQGTAAYDADESVTDIKCNGRANESGSGLNATGDFGGFRGRTSPEKCYFFSKNVLSLSTEC